MLSSRADSKEAAPYQEEWLMGSRIKLEPLSADVNNIFVHLGIKERATN